MVRTKLENSFQTWEILIQDQLWWNRCQWVVWWISIWPLKKWHKEHALQLSTLRFTRTSTFRLNHLLNSLMDSALIISTGKELSGYLRAYNALTNWRLWWEKPFKKTQAELGNFKTNIISYDRSFPLYHPHFMHFYDHTMNQSILNLVDFWWKKSGEGLLICQEKLIEKNEAFKQDIVHDQPAFD